MLALLIRLGFWQLGRAEEKRDFLANQQEMMQHKALPLTQLLSETTELRYRRVILTGHYDSTHQFLIDNQVHKGQVGYFVLTPFILADNQQTVLINRGWVRMDKNRKHLPDISFTPEDRLSIVGVINHFPQVGLALKGADEPGKGWPSVVQLINKQKVADKLNRPILDFQIQLSAEQAYGYAREWQHNVRMPPEKHVAYAFQWFALAFTLIILSLWGSSKIYKND